MRLREQLEEDRNDFASLIGPTCLKLSILLSNVRARTREFTSRKRNAESRAGNY